MKRFPRILALLAAHGALACAAGRNPIYIGIAIAGVLVVSLAQWAASSWSTLNFAAHAGGRALLILAVQIIYDVLFFAVLIRVIASWLGRFRYSPWLRPVYWLTDWIVEPIRRLLPARGPIDFSPLVALLVLWVLKQIIFQILV